MSPTLGQVAHGRDNNFNLLRMLAAMAVLVSHSFPLVHGLGTPEPLNRVGYSLGGVAVDVFFVTSGFLVTASLLRLERLPAFFRARALRIFPALLVMVPILVFLYGPVFTTLSLDDYFTHSKTWKFLAKNITLLAGFRRDLPGVFDHAPFPETVNGSLWTMPLEVRCYLAVALLWWALSRLRARRTGFAWVVLAATIAFWLMFQLALRGAADHWHAFRLFFMFFSGAALQVFRDRIPLHGGLAAAMVALLLATAWMPSAFFWVYPLVLGYVVLYAAYVPGGALRGYNRLGDYSYGIYIYAFPIQQALVASVPGIGVPALMAWSAAMTLACAVASWHWIEKPALAFKSRTLGTTDA